LSHSEPAPDGVGVIIVSWNCEAYLLRCLSALADQTHPADKIVVVDNASESFPQGEIDRRFPEVQVIRLDQNVGFAAANNLGARQSREAKWLALVNPDALPEPTWLETLLVAARRHPGYSSFASCLLLDRDPTLLDGRGDIYHTSGLAWRRDESAPLDSVANEEDDVFSPCAAAALYRRDAFEAVGGFDEDYFCYHEDVDLGFRLQLLGHRCRYVPEAVVRHASSAITGRRSDLSAYHSHRNLVWTYLKNMPWPMLLWSLPEALLLNTAAVIGFACRGQGRVIVRAKRDALLGGLTVLRKRRQIQSRRTVSCHTLRGILARGPSQPYRRGLSTWFASRPSSLGATLAQPSPAESSSAERETLRRDATGRHAA